MQKAVWLLPWYTGQRGGNPEDADTRISRTTIECWAHQATSQPGAQLKALGESFLRKMGLKKY